MKVRHGIMKGRNFGAWLGYVSIVKTALSVCHVVRFGCIVYNTTSKVCQISDVELSSTGGAGEWQGPSFGVFQSLGIGSEGLPLTNKIKNPHKKRKVPFTSSVMMEMDMST